MSMAASRSGILFWSCFISSNLWLDNNLILFRFYSKLFLWDLVIIWYEVGNLVNYIRNEESSMNQKLKQAGLFAILAVFTMSLTTSFVGNAEAYSIPEGQPVDLAVKAQQRAQALDQ